MTDSPRPRRDVVRNRERLLRAGREVFADRGLDATLNDVAHHAGVGVGTAYRHFPNKEALFSEIRRQQDTEIESLLHQALRFEDPWEGLVYYLESSLELHSKDRGMAQMLTGRFVPPELHDQSRDRIAPLHNQLADSAQRSGDLREGITGTDLAFVLIACIQISNVVHDGLPIPGRGDADRLYLRYLHIALEGLRRSPVRAEDLPGPPLTTDQLHLLLRGRPDARTGTP